MKRGTKFYLVSSTQETAGPFPWTLVREWRGLALVAENAWVCVEGSATWQALYEFAELMNLPPSVQKALDERREWDAQRHFVWPSTSTQHDYLRRLNCPFVTEALDFDKAWSLIRTLAALFPHLADHAFEGTLNAEAKHREDWRNLPPTEKQTDYLRSVGVRLSETATRGEASALIAPASDAQCRRLNFYGLNLPRLLSKEDASEMIDNYIRAHPESEGLYQQWKLENGIR